MKVPRAGATTRRDCIAVVDAVKTPFDDRDDMEVFRRLHALRRRRNRRCVVPYR
jgi:hypothetical protein